MVIITNPPHNPHNHSNHHERSLVSPGFPHRYGVPGLYGICTRIVGISYYPCNGHILVVRCRWGSGFFCYCLLVFHCNWGL